MRCLFESHAVSFLAMKMGMGGRIEDINTTIKLLTASRFGKCGTYICTEYERADSPKEHISRGFKTDH